MIFYHCDKVYHENHSSVNNQFPILSKQKLDLVQTIVLLSFQYSAIASKYKYSVENNTDSLLLYLFHPLTHEYKYTKIPTYLDAHSILESYFKEDVHLREFTTYFTSKDFKFIRTLLLFPIFLSSEGNLAGFVVFDLFSNEMMVLSPFFVIRKNIFSPSLDISFVNKLEKSLASIIYICRCFHLVKMMRPIIPSTNFNVHQESDAFIMDINSRSNINELIIDKQYLTSNNLGSSKYALVFSLFDKIVESIGVLGWKKNSLRNTTSIDSVLDQQLCFFDFILDVVFHMPTDVLKFEKNTAFGYSTTELEAKQTILSGILDDYKKGQFKSCFDLLNFHYMHVDIEGSKCLWNIILKFNEIMDSSVVNQTFAVRHMESVINNLSRWLSLAYMNNITFTVDKLYEIVYPLVNKHQLMCLLQERLMVKRLASSSKSSSQIEIENNVDLEVNNDGNDSDGNNNNNNNINSFDETEISMDSLNFIQGNSIICFPNFTEAQRSIWKNVSMESPLALLLSTSYAQHSKQLVESSNKTMEQRLRFACLHELLSREFGLIISDYDIRVMGKKSKPRIYICSFENSLIGKEGSVLSKRSSYSKILGNSKSECINKWIDSRRKTIGKFISLKDGCCFKECGKGVDSKGKYFIPVHSMISLFMKTVSLLGDRKDVTSRKFSFLLKRNIKIWLFDLPENPTIWSEEDKDLSKSIDTDSIIININWFHDLFTLLNNVSSSNEDDVCNDFV